MSGEDYINLLISQCANVLMEFEQLNYRAVRRSEDAPTQKYTYTPQLRFASFGDRRRSERLKRSEEERF